MTTYIGLAAIVFYLLATLKLGKNLLATGSDEQPRASAWFLGLAATALLLHGFVLYQNIDTFVGLNLGFYNALSLMSWTASLIVVITSLNKPLENLALAIFPVTALAIVLEIIFQGTRILPDSSPAGLRVHILLSIGAYSLLTIAALQALLLALQNRQIANKHPASIMRLPPMQLMEKLLIQIIAAGFFLLSLSLATGLMFVYDVFGQHLIHKTVLSILAWFIFGILLLGHWLRGWRGKRIVHWTIGGFISLLLAYFGSKLVLELILNRV